MFSKFSFLGLLFPPQIQWKRTAVSSQSGEKRKKYGTLFGMGSTTVQFPHFHRGVSREGCHLQSCYMQFAQRCFSGKHPWELVWNSTDSSTTGFSLHATCYSLFDRRRPKTWTYLGLLAPVQPAATSTRTCAAVFVFHSRQSNQGRAKLMTYCSDKREHLNTSNLVCATTPFRKSQFVRHRICDTAMND